MIMVIDLKKIYALKQKILADFSTAKHESSYSDALKANITDLERAAQDCDWHIALGKALESGQDTAQMHVTDYNASESSELMQDYTPSPQMQQYLDALKDEHNFNDVRLFVRMTINLDRYVMLQLHYDADKLNPATKKAAEESLAQDRKRRFSMPEYQELEERISEQLSGEALNAEIEDGHARGWDKNRYSVLKLESDQFLTDTHEYLNHVSPAFTKFKEQQQEKGIYDVSALLDIPLGDFYVFVEVAFQAPKPQKQGLCDSLKEKISP
jgi:hypothetical protein